VSGCEKIEEKANNVIVASKVTDEDRGVQEVSGQARPSVRLVFRTQSRAAPRSRQCV
jgi:hypothetical protein